MNTNEKHKDPFDDIFKKDRILDLDICNNPPVQLQHILNKADEAKEKKDFELEILYLIHYLVIEANNYEIYDNIFETIFRSLILEFGL
jgi:hypothetical protein